MKARVFLSCGQSKSSAEPVIAEQVARRIQEDHGLDCYIAVADTTLIGLRENIFAQLNAADYLIFIDFKREELKTNEPGVVHRGSLFSHQELAIASFLEVPALVLQERGVKRLDGMLAAMQANASEFSDRDQLANIVSALVGTKLRLGEWNNQSRNLLTLETAAQFVDAQSNGVLRRYFHISVRNHHHRKAALHCFAYLDTVLDLGNSEETRPETVEIKWAGTWMPSVRIGPCSSRNLDAFWMPHLPPIKPAFNVLSDSTAYFLDLPRQGRYKLTYSVVSENFPPAKQSFLLGFGTTLESVKFATS